MVSQATIQAHVNKGYGKAAAAAGVACRWYRPSGPANPLVQANLLGSKQALINTSANLANITPRQRQKPEGWFAGLDVTGVRIGDYLVQPDGDIYFITTLDDFSPVRLVLCNATVHITSPAAMPTLGFNPGYGGDIRGQEHSVVSDWPVALIKGPRGETGDVKLPGDTKLPWEELFLPAIPGAVIRNDMIVTHNDGAEDRRLILSLVELTSLGYRCTAILETA